MLETRLCASVNEVEVLLLTSGLVMPASLLPPPGSVRVTTLMSTVTLLLLTSSRISPTREGVATTLLLTSSRISSTREGVAITCLLSSGLLSLLSDSLAVASSVITRNLTLQPCLHSAMLSKMLGPFKYSGGHLTMVISSQSCVCGE